jgi:hypothetical protein
MLGNSFRFEFTDKIVDLDIILVDMAAGDE